MDITRRVKNLTKKHKTNCPFQLADLLNINVWFLELGDNCRGYYLRTLRRRYIAINSSLSDEWQRFVCAHELGHDRLHSGMTGYYFIEQHTLFNPGKFERQANSYAVKLLLGNDSPMEDEGIESYCMRNGVPVEMTKYIKEGDGQ
ncbi:MAG: ImmA/IrrE family metallo-endopeptidase [Bacilli bacterium]|nr:ImmA/IrrE family metallo-endopeptidase [Bacilli bacterium]